MLNTYHVVVGGLQVNPPPTWLKPIYLVG